MNSDPANHQPRSLEQETVADAAKNIADLFAHAPREERLKLVEALGETLNDAGLAVIDTSGSNEGERLGVNTGLNHDTFVAVYLATRAARLRRKLTGQPRRLDTRPDIT